MIVSRSYCLITPCRDEAKYARLVLDSVLAQTIQPTLWVIVDDGSQDETPAILDEYAKRHDFIKIIRREDRGKRAVGPGVIEAFYTGYETIEPDRFEYICKFDLDLEVPEGYFEGLMDRMEANPKLGTCSGKPYFKDPKSERLISEKCGDEMSVGMTKFYRVKCFEDIGGFVRQVMWDGIDCHTCRMKGWMAMSWDDPELRFVHLRPMGASDKNWYRGRIRHGFGQYFMGTSPLYMAASVSFRMTRPPLVVGGLAMGWGYIRSWFGSTPRFDDPVFRRYLRRYQWDCLVRGKRAATERIHNRIASTQRG
ncbi:MAG: glycosyltransferase family 2 protein [Planctomycetota bacterium]|nr:glycosyltransferase family 2 protein [Planctomycetota bacterium]